MADTSTRTRISNPPASKKVTRFLAYVLRHGPDTVGVGMDRRGWVPVDALIERSTEHRALTRPMLEDIVATDGKRRFVFSEDGTKIRAVNGHSVDVDLGLRPLQPPATLYHGTAVYNVTAILRNGLLPIGRNHVHLSADRRTAADIGGKLAWPKVLAVDSAAMAADGLVFHRSENGIWLSGPVPPKYLTVVDEA